MRQAKFLKRDGMDMRGGYYWVWKAGYKIVAEYDPHAEVWFEAGKQGTIDIDSIIAYIPYPKTK